MARIDVTELLTDPDFVDAITHVQRASVVSTRGKNIIKETLVRSVGVIQPADGKTLRRLPEGLLNEDLSSFWFKGAIGDTDGCKYPSVLIFKGKRYQVKKVFGWLNWGAGWVEGVCVAENLV